VKPISLPVKAAGVLTIAAIVGTTAWWKVYEAPRKELESQIVATNQEVSKYEDLLADRAAVRRSLREFGARTLGSQQDLVDHRFRTLLTRVVSEAGLERVVVDQGQPNARANPATSSLPSGVRAYVRSHPDFAVIKGTVRGEGGLEQVLRALAAVRDQPWVHVVDAFSIKPVGKEGDRFSLRVDLATGYAPDLVTEDVPPTITPTKIETEQAWRPVLAKNVFREPPPARDVPSVPNVTIAAAPTTPPGPPPAVPAPPPPYEEWRLTGIVSGSRGAEAMFVNVKTNERLTVLAGGQVLNAKLVEASGERAVVEIDGAKFELFNGETLAARRPVGT
jgi:hypothetical protein